MNHKDGAWAKSRLLKIRILAALQTLPTRVWSVKCGYAAYRYAVKENKICRILGFGPGGLRPALYASRAGIKHTHRCSLMFYSRSGFILKSKVFRIDLLNLDPCAHLPPFQTVE